MGGYERAVGTWVLALGARRAGPAWAQGVSVTLASELADKGVALESRAGPQRVLPPASPIRAPWGARPQAAEPQHRQDASGHRAPGRHATSPEPCGQSPSMAWGSHPWAPEANHSPSRLKSTGLGPVSHSGRTTFAHRAGVSPRCWGVLPRTRGWQGEMVGGWGMGAAKALTPTPDPSPPQTLFIRALDAVWGGQESVLGPQGGQCPVPLAVPTAGRPGCAEMSSS